MGLKLVVNNTEKQRFQSYHSQLWSEFFRRAGIAWSFTERHTDIYHPEFNIGNQYFHVMTVDSFPDKEQSLQDIADQNNKIVNAAFNYPINERCIEQGYIMRYYPNSHDANVIDAFDDFGDKGYAFAYCDLCKKYRGVMPTYTETMKVGGCCRQGRVTLYREEILCAGYDEKLSDINGNF